MQASSLSDAQTLTDLRVGVVFTNTATTLGQGTATTQFAAIRQASDVTFQNSGLGQPEYFMYPFVVGQPGTNTEALRAVPTINPNIRQWREDNAIDVVLFVVANTSDQDSCGSAQPVEDELPGFLDVFANQLTLWGLFSYSDKRYVAIVTNFQCSEPTDVIAVHEFGHMLWAEHEVCSFNETDCPAPDALASLPVPYNHPHRDGNLTTMMHTPTFGTPKKVFSGVGNVFPSNPGVPAGASNADNKRMFVENTMPYTALFRPKPGAFSPPDPPTCTWEYSGCVNNQKEFLLSWSNGSGQSSSLITEIYMESSSNGVNWFSSFVGDLVCAPQILSSPRQFRIFGITIEGGLTGYCHITVPGDSNCGDEEGW